jgi:glycosyltransferase involved in cell wall biosynthesis
MPEGLADRIILVDDASDDATVQLAHELGLEVHAHQVNLGYGANQKTCYSKALEGPADIVITLHPDYQYDPRLLGAMASMIASGVYDVVLGSRILGGRARQGGMPLYKYVSNRVLTAIQNLLLGSKISEFHTGYRAFSREVLETLPLRVNSNDFVFDSQMLTQCIAFGFDVGEISCPTRYFPEASTISLSRSIVYGFGVLATSLLYRAWKMGICRPTLFSRSPSLVLQQPSA